MTDTPETDALNRSVNFTSIEGYLAMIRHARKLERERDMLAEALRYITEASDGSSVYRRAKTALDKLTKQ